MRRLFKTTLTPTFLRPGYTYCRCTENDIKRLIRSKRVRQIEYVDDYPIIYNKIGSGNQWTISNEITEGYRHNDIFLKVVQHHLDENHPLRISFYKSIKENCCSLLKIIRQDDQYFIGIPWMLYDMTYSYPADIINGELRNSLDLRKVISLTIVISSGEFSSVEYKFVRRYENEWLGTLSIDQEHVIEIFTINDMERALSLFPASVLNGARVYISHRISAGGD